MFLLLYFEFFTNMTLLDVYLKSLIKDYDVYAVVYVAVLKKVLFNSILPPPCTVLKASTSLARLSAPVLSHSTMSESLLHIATANALQKVFNSYD